MNLDENFPTKGRLLFFELTQGSMLQLKHQEPINGSVQSISSFDNHPQYLLVGVNLEVVLYQFSARSGASDLKLLPAL